MKRVAFALAVAAVTAVLFAPALAGTPRSSDSLAVQAPAAETQCPPGAVASSEGCITESTDYRGSDPFKGTNIARAKQEREAREKAAHGKSAPGGGGTSPVAGSDESTMQASSPSTCCDTDVDNDGIAKTTPRKLEPQPYKAKTGSSGSTK